MLTRWGVATLILVLAAFTLGALVGAARRLWREAHPHIKIAADTRAS